MEVLDLSMPKPHATSVYSLRPYDYMVQHQPTYYPSSTLPPDVVQPSVSHLGLFQQLQFQAWPQALPHEFRKSLPPSPLPQTSPQTLPHEFRKPLPYPPLPQASPHEFRKLLPHLPLPQASPQTLPHKFQKPLHSTPLSQASPKTLPHDFQKILAHPPLSQALSQTLSHKFRKPLPSTPLPQASPQTLSHEFRKPLPPPSLPETSKKIMPYEFRKPLPPSPLPQTSPQIFPHEFQKPLPPLPLPRKPKAAHNPNTSKISFKQKSVINDGQNLVLPAPVQRPFKSLAASKPVALTLVSALDPEFEEEYEKYREKILLRMAQEEPNKTNRPRVSTVLPNPEKCNDPEYIEKRRKNNEAAKKSREARRAKEDELAIRVAFLEKRNLEMKYQLAAIEVEKKMILKRNGLL